MIRPRTTLSEISEALNLSISTVSKSLSDSTEISTLTKKRVQDFAKQCNYIPNSLASSFRKGLTNTIGLVIPDILNPFYAKVLHSIENYLDNEGYRLIASISNESKDKEIKSTTKMAGGYVDGLIICVSKETLLNDEYDHINSLVRQGMPVVLFDRLCDIADCDKVIINDYKVAFDITEHLIKNKNCKNILMASLISNLHHGKLRADGFKDAIEEHAIQINGKIVVANSPAILKQKLKNTLNEDKTIDAIFGVNDQAVLQAMLVKRYFNTKGFINNITIAGFCNKYQSNYDSSIITVNQNAEKTGIHAAQLILNRIKSTDAKGFQTKTIAANLN